MRDAGGYVAQAQSLIAVGRQADAVPLLRQAIASEPQAAFPRCLLAACQIDLGQFPEALRMTESALALDPENALAHRLRSSALRAMGRAKPALIAAQSAVRLSPADPNSLKTLGEAQLANKQLKQAWTSGEQVIGLEPAAAAGHILLGRVALRQKRWKQAEAACRQALRLEPTNWAAMNNLGLALQGQHRQKEAIEAFENAARLNPRSEIARQNLFYQTRRYLLPGAAIALFLIVRLIIATRAYLNPIAIALAVLLLGAGFGAVLLIRRRQLSPVARTFYDLEKKRQRMRIGAYYLGWYAGWIGILLIGYAAFQLTKAGAVLLVLVAAAVGWWIGWPRLYHRSIAPRITSRRRT